MGKSNKKKKKKKKGKNSLFHNLENESNFSLFEVIVIIFISVIFGVIIGYMLTYGNSNLSRVRSDTNLGEVVRTYNSIVDNYYNEVDEEELAESAIKGMVSSLQDPYSAFLDEDSTSSFNESVDGQYVGIGITIESRNGYSEIISVVEDGPADKAGLKVDDVILSIDDHDCKNLSSTQISELVDGEVGTTLKMKVLRDEKEKTFTVTRRVVEIQNVTGDTYEVNGKKIGYLKINVFSSNSYSQFVTELNYMEKKKIKGLILDLRDNPGGHLNQARDILSLFFDKNTVLYQIASKGSKKKVYATMDDVRNYPIVVLINHETASSSEVVASCFKDNYKNVHIVGTNSYGKGNVQKSLSLGMGTSVKFTIEEWLTPKGESVSGKGISPTLYLEQDPEYFTTYEEEKDVQLQKAFSLLQ